MNEETTPQITVGDSTVQHINASAGTNDKQLP